MYEINKCGEITKISCITISCHLFSRTLFYKFLSFAIGIKMNLIPIVTICQVLHHTCHTQDSNKLAVVVLPYFISKWWFVVTIKRREAKNISHKWLWLLWR